MNLTEGARREVARLLTAKGRFVLRVFARPGVAESVEDIARDLTEGSIGDINALKLRLYGAVHGDGARLHDVPPGREATPLERE